jgi:hypothetical protein
MNEKYTIIRLGVLLALTAVLVGLVFHSFTSANAAPPVPTPTLQAETELQENQPLTDPPISPADFIATGVVTFYATADTQVLQGHPTMNYGIGPTMRTGYDACPGETPGIDRSLVRFDLSHVPPGTTINSARLDLYYSGSCGYSSQYLTITTYQITGDWQEEGVTWNIRPSPGTSYGSVPILHSAWGWYSFDVTELVRSWVNGDSNYGIMLRGPETAPGWRQFYTKGASRYVYGPRLIVDLELSPPTLSAAPSSMQFTNDFAGPITQTKELVVQNLGEDILDWSASESVSWLSLDKTSGTAVRFTSPDTIRVSVDRSGLSPDHYTGQIQITSSTTSVQGSPQYVDVTFDLAEELPRVYLPVVFGGMPTQDIVALIIGISEYENMGPYGQTSGRAGAPGYFTMHSHEDAVRFGNVVDEKCCGLSSGSLGGMASQSASCSGVKLLLDSWATKETIRQAIIYWLDEHENENTTVIFFFSGHGMYAQDIDGDEADGYDEFLVPYDIQYDDQQQIWLPETAIRDDEFGTWLDELESNQIVVIVDSCFSGGIAAGATASSRGLLSQADMGAGAANLQAGDAFAQDVNESGRVVLMASAADQASWESSALEHGVFTYFLIEALSSTSADTNQNGWVSAEEAFSYLESRVDSYVQSHIGYYQYPQISDGVAGEVNLTQP